MKIRTLIACLGLFAVTASFAQTSEFLGELRGMKHRQKGYSYQGMDVWKDYVFSCQNHGAVTIYKLKKDGFKEVSQFKLASFRPENHANVASFGPDFFEKGDPMPIVYVSHCSKMRIDGRKDLLFVERVAKNMRSSELLQTIFYDDVNGDFGYALQWVVDKENRMLYGYGNTINNTDPANRHRIIKFRLPELTEGKFVVLRPEDALENYLIEDVSRFRFNPVGQDLAIEDGKLYMPTGVGDDKYPSILYIWDLKKKKMEVVDLVKITHSEFEGIGILKGKGKGRQVLIQSQDGLYRITL